MIDLLQGLTGLLCLAILGAAYIAIREPSANDEERAAGATDVCLRGRRGIALAILASGLVSLIASVLFLILASPDVAMTEAAIGSGLTTFLFFFVLDRVRGDEEQQARHDGGHHG